MDEEWTGGQEAHELEIRQQFGTQNWAPPVSRNLMLMNASTAAPPPLTSITAVTAQPKTNFPNLGNEDTVRFRNGLPICEI
jgi:hypothetical protein